MRAVQPLCAVVQGYNQGTTWFCLSYGHKHIQAMCSNRLDLEGSDRGGLYCLFRLGGFFAWLDEGVGGSCGAGCKFMHHFSSSSFHFTQQTVSGVASRVCKYQTSFTVEN